jgi:hypothetical protein
MVHDRISGRSSPPRAGWSGRFALTALHLLDLESGSGSRDFASSEDLDALESLSSTLRQAESSDSWEALRDTALLSGHNDDSVGLEERERILHDRIPSLAHVVERFATRLGEASEILPVARVKRPARRAFDRLAGHTEDWEGRTITGPIPRRALAITRYEDANLYENRMVVELVHPILTSALLIRIRMLRRLVSDLADLNAAEHVGTHRRTDRLYSFWGVDSSRAKETQRLGQETLKALERLALTIQRLRGSTLSTLIGGRVTGQRSLRQTNIIRNDRHYRSVGEVWTAYQRHEVAAEQPEERRERLKDRHQIFDLYVLGLSLRALESLGYQPRSDALPSPGEEVSLTGPWGEASLAREVDGVLTLECHGAATRFVPLLDMVTPNDDSSFTTRRWEELSKEVDSRTVVVYLASSVGMRNMTNLKVAAMMSSAMDDWPTQGTHLTGIPVSPLETTSLERVARAIGLATRIPALMAYPPALHIDNADMPPRLIEHLSAAQIAETRLSPLLHRSKGGLALRRPLTAREQASLEAVVRSMTDATRGNGWQRDYAKSIGQVLDAFHRASSYLNFLYTCPVCERKDPRQQDREGDTFLLECPHCDTRWGHERCGNCKCRVPIIEPEQKLLNPNITGPGWVERIFGQDALASPCWSRIAANRYICPACKKCPLEFESADSACVRCC